MCSAGHLGLAGDLPIAIELFLQLGCSQPSFRHIGSICLNIGSMNTVNIIGFFLALSIDIGIIVRFFFFLRGSHVSELMFRTKVARCFYGV